MILTGSSMNDLFKLLILEDEEDIRRGLATLVDWNRLGFSVAASFKDADAAIEYLQNQSVDALLTDICLGGTSGLDVAKWLNKNRPSTRVVILSGYSDFTYAQQALTYRVSKYLLKPIDIPELEETFREIRSELVRTTSDHRRYQNANRYCLRSLLCLMLTNGQYREEFSWLLRTAPESAANGSWILAQLHASSAHSDLDTLFSRYYDNCDSFTLSAFCQGKDLYLLALSHRDTPRTLRDFRLLLEQNIDRFVQQHNIILSLMSLHQAASPEALEHLLKPAAVSSADNVLIHQVVGYVNDMDFFALQNILDRCDEDILRMLGTLLLSRLSQLDARLCEHPLVMDDSEYRRFSQETGQELTQHIREVIGMFQQYVSQTNNRIISRACLYIDNCQGRKVSLAEVAEQVFVSPTYLSRLFKQEKNINFKAYVSALTLDAAKKILLNSDIRIYDVSEQLGFKDIRHFYKFFSNGTGMTPTEYRKSLRRDL